METDFELVILTAGSYGTPHLATIRAMNPDLVIHVHTAGQTGEDGWRNCDRNIREFWQEKAGDVAAKSVLFFEHDVYANVPLKTVVPALQKRTGILCAAVKSPVSDGRSWWPFQEAGKLPPDLRSLVIGTAPMAVALCAREALDAAADARWDDVFAADIFCEIRLGTIMRACGFLVAGCRAWKDVGTRPMVADPQAGGIFHPVKMEVPR